MSRRRFLGIGIAAAATIAAIGVAATNVPANMFGLLSGNEGGTVADSTHEGNWFSLRAYADEPNTPANEVRDLDVGYIVPKEASGGDANMFASSYEFDFSIVGSNIETVTYAIEGSVTPASEDYANGDGYTWEYVTFQERTLTQEGIDANGKPVEDVRFENITSFTVDYNDQSGSIKLSPEEPVQRLIYIKIRQPDEAIEILDAMTAEPEGSFKETELSNDFFALCGYEAALMLAAHPLSITATFSDGTTETKRYRIAPADDFEERYRFITTFGYIAEAVGSSLFTITEIGDE